MESQDSVEVDLENEDSSLNSTEQRDSSHEALDSKEGGELETFREEWREELRYKQQVKREPSTNIEEQVANA